LAASDAASVKIEKTAWSLLPVSSQLTAPRAMPPTIKQDNDGAAAGRKLLVSAYDAIRQCCANADLGKQRHRCQQCIEDRRCRRGSN
jgi:hypothetical protein